MYAKQIPGSDESMISFARRCGYRLVDDGGDGEVLEKEERYHERMAGVIAVYAAVMCSTAGKQGNVAYGMDFAWPWLARIVNLKPRKVTAHLIQSFLEVCP